MMLCARVSGGLAVIGGGVSVCAVVLPNDPTNIHGLMNLDGNVGAIVDGRLGEGIGRDLGSPKAMAKRVGITGSVSLGMSNARSMYELSGSSRLSALSGGVGSLGAGTSNSVSGDGRTWVRTAGWYPRLGASIVDGEGGSFTW